MELLRLAVSSIEGLKRPARSSLLKFTPVLPTLPFTKLPVEGAGKGPFGLVGDFVLTELEDCFLLMPGRLGFEADAARCWPICVGELVFAIEPLFIKLEGRSPNLGNAN